MARKGILPRRRRGRSIQVCSACYLILCKSDMWKWKSSFNIFYNTNESILSFENNELSIALHMRWNKNMRKIRNVSVNDVILKRTSYVSQWKDRNLFQNAFINDKTYKYLIVNN